MSKHSEGTDWTVRHARTRHCEAGPCVVVEDVDDDWHRRHAEIRRFRPN
jgi:hypothetical protein